MKKYMSMFLFIFSLASCVTYKYVPLPDSNIQIKVDRGSSIPLYVDEQMAMIIMANDKESDIVFQIYMKNLTANLLKVNDSDFSVYASNDKLKWKKVNVYSSQEYYSKEKTEYIATAAIMVLGAVANSYNSSYGYRKSSGSFYGNSSYGGYYGNYESYSQYYDPVATELALQRNSQMISSYSEKGLKWLEYLEKNLFYSKDLEPNEQYYGLVFAEGGYRKYYKIVLSNPQLKRKEIIFEKVSIQ